MNDGEHIRCKHILMIMRRHAAVVFGKSIRKRMFACRKSASLKIETNRLQQEFRHLALGFVAYLARKKIRADLLFALLNFLKHRHQTLLASVKALGQILCRHAAFVNIQKIVIRYTHRLFRKSYLLQIHLADIR